MSTVKGPLGSPILTVAHITTLRSQPKTTSEPEACARCASKHIPKIPGPFRFAKTMPDFIANESFLEQFRRSLGGKLPELGPPKKILLFEALDNNGKGLV